MTTLVLFDAPPRHWLRLDGDRIVERGEGPVLVATQDERIAAIVPGAETVVHQLDLAGLTDAQARGAARLALAETAIVPVDTLHVAVGPEVEGSRTVVAMESSRLAQRLADLAANGIDPDVLVPAVLIPPPPAEGFVRMQLGDEAVVRGGNGLAFVDDPALTPLLAPGDIATLDREGAGAALVAAVAAPPVDLRQGAFARRRRWALDHAKLRRIAMLAAACLVTLLLVPLAELINLNWTISAIEARNLARVQAALPGAVVVNPVAQLEEKLGAVGLQNGGFAGLSEAVARAVEAVPGVELDRLAYSGPEGLRAAVRAPNAADFQALLAKLAAAGLVATEGGGAASGGVREIVVKRQ